MTVVKAIRNSEAKPTISMPAARWLRLELAVRARGGKFAAESASHRRDDHAHVLGGFPGLVPSDVPVTGILVALTRRNDVRCAGRIVRFVKRDLSLRDGDEDRAWVGMPSRGGPWSVVVLSHNNVERCPDRRFEIDSAL